MGKVLDDALHSGLKGPLNVFGVRVLGSAGAVERSSIPGVPGKRAYCICMEYFRAGVLVRPAGKNLVVCPPYMLEKRQTEQIVAVLADALRKNA